jgi:DUF1365 family protein
MQGTTSAIYAGTVIHRRFRPVAHTLQYGMFTTLLDLSEVPRLDATLRWFSHGRANLVSWRPEDHLSGSIDLRGEVDGILAGAGLDPSGGSVQLLAMPRMFGFTFNPISTYLCHRSDGALHAVLYEVNNTFGDRHSYLFPVPCPDGVRPDAVACASGGGSEGGRAGACAGTYGASAASAMAPAHPPAAARPSAGGTLRHGCAKALHVSPFNAMDLRYDFRLRAPGATFGLRIDVADGDGPLMVAAERLRRRPLTDREIIRGLLEFPFQTLAVVGGIHLEAFRLWRKGLGIKRRPPPPRHAVSAPGATRT